jgi:hypothetical protein
LLQRRHRFVNLLVIWCDCAFFTAAPHKKAAKDASMTGRRNSKETAIFFGTGVIFSVAPQRGCCDIIAVRHR